MLNNILNLEGVAVLDKKQQVKVNGGGSCTMRYFDENGNQIGGGYTWNNGNSSQADTLQAHQNCAWALNNGADRCFYDCDYDGIG